MQLLVAVVNHEEHVDDILAGFIELGITGATVLESRGMGHLLSREVPIFAGVRSLSALSRPENRTLFCVVDDEKADAAIAMVQANTRGDLFCGAGPPDRRRRLPGRDRHGPGGRRGSQRAGGGDRLHAAGGAGRWAVAGAGMTPGGYGSAWHGLTFALDRPAFPTRRSRLGVRRAAPRRRRRRRAFP